MAKDMWLSRYKTAREDYLLALNHFNYADEDHIDIAIEELTNTQIILNNIIKIMRRKEGYPTMS